MLLEEKVPVNARVFLSWKKSYTPKIPYKEGEKSRDGLKKKKSHRGGETVTVGSYDFTFYENARVKKKKENTTEIEEGQKRRRRR